MTIARPSPEALFHSSVQPGVFWFAIGIAVAFGMLMLIFERIEGNKRRG